MKKIYITLFLVCLGWAIHAQTHVKDLKFENFPTDITCLNGNGDTLSFPWVGGFNIPQFSNFDFNKDGFQDLLVYDKTGDFLMPLLYVKKLNGYGYQPAPEYLRYFPDRIRNFVMSVDYNQDGKQDIIYHDGFTGIKRGKNISSSQDTFLTFETPEKALTYSYYRPGKGIQLAYNLEVDKGSIPFIGDMDADDDMDVLSYLSNDWGITFFKNTTKEKNLGLDTLAFDETDRCWGDFREQVLINDVYYSPSIYCSDWYRTFKKKHAGGSSLLMLDMDHDGDLDLVMGNAGFDNLILLKNGRLEMNTDRDTIVASDTLFPSNTAHPARIQNFPAPHYVDYDGDGVKDLLVSVNQTDRVFVKYKETQNIMQYKNTGTNDKPVFAFDNSNFITENMIDVGGRAAPALVDYDGDGDLDLVIASNGDYTVDSDVNDQLYLYENIGTVKTPVFKFKTDDFLGIKNSGASNSAPHFADLTGDGLYDLLLGQGNGEIRFYKNVGSKGNPNMQLVTNSFGNIKVDFLATPFVFDVDNDQKLDLLVGNQRGYIQYYKCFGNPDNGDYQLEDDSFGNVFVNQFRYDVNPPGYFFYGNSAPALVADKDGNMVLFSGSIHGVVRKFTGSRSQVKSQFIQDTTFLFDAKYNSYTEGQYGEQSFVSPGDLNNDGVVDLVIGNSRGGVNIVMGTADTSKIDGLLPLANPLDVKLYPNPAQSVVYFELNKKLNHPLQIELFDLSGKKVLQQEIQSGVYRTEIATDSLANGLYVLKASNVTSGFSHSFKVSILR